MSDMTCLAGPLTSKMLERGNAVRARQRISESMDALFTSKVLVVQAPKGSGSTSAVSSWCAQRVAEGKLLPAWIDVAHQEIDEQQLIGAIQSEVSEALRRFPVDDQIRREPSTLMAAFSQWSKALPSDLHFVVVLDGYSPELPDSLHRAIDRCIAVMPTNQHILCIGTREPPLSLTLRRAVGEAVLLDYEQVRFTLEETRDFVQNACQRAFGLDAARVIHDATGGWAVGLKLVCFSLVEQPGLQLPSSIQKCRRLAAVDKFVDEVLMQLDDDLRPFALEAGTLGFVPQAMAETALGWREARKVMCKLEHESPCFILQNDVLESQPLVRARFDCLLKRVDRRRYADVHRFACDWLLEHRKLSQALPHALALCDWKLAATIARAKGRALIERGETGAFIELEDVDESLCVKEYPELVLCKAGSCLSHGKVHQALELVKLAAKADDLMLCCLSGMESGPSNSIELSYRALLTQLLSLLGRYARALEIGREVYQQREHLEPIERCWMALGLGHAVVHAASPEEAIEFLSGETLHARASGCLSTELAIGYLLGNQYIERLKLTRAEDVFRQLARSVERSGARQTPLMLLPWLGLAKVSLWRGDASAVEAFLERDAPRLRELADPFFYLEARMLESETLRLKRSYEASLVVLREVMRASDDGVFSSVSVKQATAQLFVDEGQEARCWLEHSLTSNDKLPLDLLKDETLQLGQCRVLVRSNPQEAARMSGELVRISRLRGRDAALVQALLVQAVALHRTGELKASTRAVSEAVRLAAAEGAILPFLGGEGVHTPLLEHLLEPGSVQGAMLAPNERKFVALALRLTPKTHEEDQSFPSQSSSQLTTREYEVMRLLAQGHTMEQTAELMGVSQSTVNTHRTNLYAKLGIHTRKQLKAVFEQMHDAG